ncbi:serine/threonine-protein kinase [Nocardioides sp.]|uniref:serine/threonine-protein kinase n=1 Tax=Nocardioides sp. TaxID=35761 RepID=UPI0026030113|nr:serine/threonine-protein kinase [Nocardioides sp.]
MPAVPPVLRERYRLEARLGSGGTADVHRATDTTLQRPVAVKLLRDVAGDASDRGRFVAEARTLASLSHRNLVMVLDAGIGDEDDRPFLVMELVEGRALSDALRQGPLPAREVARIGAEVAAGLAFAHERGVVHRDVKPGNVLLSDDGRVKLADFGIARLIGDTVRHTRTGTAIGTAAYLAPEQVRGEDVTGCADVYALGLVLLEALTGQRAFPGSATEAALARLHRDPDVPDDLPAGWPALLRAMTAADPAARPTTAEVVRVCSAGATATADGALPALVTDARALGTGTGSGSDAGDDPTPTAVLTAPVATTSVVPAGVAGAGTAGTPAAAAGRGAESLATAGSPGSPDRSGAGQAVAAAAAAGAVAAPAAEPAVARETTGPADVSAATPVVGPLGVRPAVPALDRAGDTLARVPGLLAARWRGLEPHQRGLAGSLAALVLLILITAVAAGAATTQDPGRSSDPVRPGETSSSDTGEPDTGEPEPEPDAPAEDPAPAEELVEDEGPGLDEDRGPAGGPPGLEKKKDKGPKDKGPKDKGPKKG